MMTEKYFYPHTNIEVKQGDVIYSPIGRSTYFVGHSVIVGANYTIKEVIPGQPGWHLITIENYFKRHRRGDEITILRAKQGGFAASVWIANNITRFKKYTILNFDMNDLSESYCYKFVAQAYWFGAGIQLATHKKRLLLPNDIKKSRQLERVAVIRI